MKEQFVVTFTLNKHIATLKFYAKNASEAIKILKEAVSNAGYCLLTCDELDVYYVLSIRYGEIKIISEGK